MFVARSDWVHISFPLAIHAPFVQVPATLRPSTTINRSTAANMAVEILLLPGRHYKSNAS